jgi:8-oxo-dGTP diphosphatase
METIRLTADVVLLTHADDVLHVLLIERGWPPFAGKLALPGGHVDDGETFVDAARRELIEETGLTAPAELDQVDVYGDPGRDPRGRYVTVSFIGYLPGMPPPTAGDDAVAARWCPVEEILDRPNVLAFDHRRIVTDAVERLRATV